MADNVTTQVSALATIPDATVIATDDVAGVHYQRFKLDVGADGASAALSNANPVPVSDASGSLTIDAPVGTPAFVRLSDGSAAIATLPVSLASVPSHAVTNAGTFAVQAALTAGTNTNEVVGDVAQDAAVAGNPLLVGGRASTATPTAMSADGDSVYQWLTRTGAAVVSGDIVDDAPFTVATTRVQAIGCLADETATDSVDEGDLGAPRMTLDRKQVTTLYAHAAAGGHSPFKSLDLDESEEEIKATAGKLFWIHAINLTASLRYLKLYNATAATVAVGTTVPVLTFPIPTLATTNGAGFCLHFGDAGLQFSTAICAAVTTGAADADAGAPGAGDVIFNCGWI